MVMIFFSDIEIYLKDIIGYKTLIIGELGSGKTLFTSKIIDELVENGYGDDMTVIDLAPGKDEVGVPISHYTKKVELVIYLYPKKIYAPRLTASNPAELDNFIYLNYIESRKLLLRYIEKPTKILVINDLSIFLHYGTVHEILEAIGSSETFIGNAYYGYRIKDLFQTGLDEMEREKIRRLINYMDRVIEL